MTIRVRPSTLVPNGYVVEGSCGWSSALMEAADSRRAEVEHRKNCLEAQR